MNLFIRFGFGLLILQHFAYAANVIEPVTQLTFPPSVKIANNEIEVSLELTGVAIRTKFFVDIYALAHYMQNPIKLSQERVFEEVLRDNKLSNLH